MGFRLVNSGRRVRVGVGLVDRREVRGSDKKCSVGLISKILHSV